MQLEHEHGHGPTDTDVDVDMGIGTDMDALKYERQIFDIELLRHQNQSPLVRQNLLRYQIKTPNVECQTFDIIFKSFHT